MTVFTEIDDFQFAATENEYLQLHTNSLWKNPIFEILS
jgi:hypothetical protein